jgi:hypothetical protein
VADIVRAAGGPTTVASDHGFRSSKIVDFYRRRAGLAPDELSYVTADERFFISSDPEAADPPSACSTCTLLGRYPSSRLSGEEWRVYSRGGSGVK